MTELRGHVVGRGRVTLAPPPHQNSTVRFLRGAPYAHTLVLGCSLRRIHAPHCLAPSSCQPWVNSHPSAALATGCRK
eukprot:scaffold4708_cov128-Isochrysis_galbana.AAC.6